MKVIIIGSGNVATVMGSRIAASGHTILQVMARREEPAARLAALFGCGYTTQWEEISREADLYIVSISDKALAGLGDVLQLPGRLVVHTAGAVAGNVLLNVSANSGVLYPLQSMRSGILPFPEFPLLIAANQPQDLPVIETFARTIASQVQQADDE
ncbi:MAG TPA: NAD(P)-binding domain-containing protein, partial [Puia sp.]|nr:NAD(P)-binding domain-containing protein [Puia sp.]